LIVFGIGLRFDPKRDFFTGFWTILVGLFLYDAAKGIISRKLQKFRADMLVEEVMQLAVYSVDA
jgi:ribulose bisphosphate carboxylase small subunit